jgi:hypothetical protein
MAKAIRPIRTIRFIGLQETNTIGYYLTPTRVSEAELKEPSVEELARVIKADACIEASFKRGKGEVGMDEYQVRT